MPGTTWPVIGSPPDSSWSLVLTPVLMPPKTIFDTSTAIRLHSPSRSPPDASCAPFPTRSRQRSSSQCRSGRFDASPRRATPKGHNLHLPRSSTIDQGLLPTHRPLPFARVAHARSGSWPPWVPARVRPAGRSAAPARLRPARGNGTSPAHRRLMPTPGLCRVVWVAAGEAGERGRARGIIGALVGRDRRCPGSDVVSGPGEDHDC
jgi:hypothetical protein